MRSLRVRRVMLGDNKLHYEADAFLNKQYSMDIRDFLEELRNGRLSQ